MGNARACLFEAYIANFLGQPQSIILSNLESSCSLGSGEGCAVLAKRRYDMGDKYLGVVNAMESLQTGSDYLFNNIDFGVGNRVPPVVIVEDGFIDSAIFNLLMGWFDRDKYRDLRIGLQQELKDAGYYNGPIDGLLGPSTLRAMRSFCGC